MSAMAGAVWSAGTYPSTPVLFTALKVVPGLLWVHDLLNYTIFTVYGVNILRQPTKNTMITH